MQYLAKVELLIPDYPEDDKRQRQSGGCHTTYGFTKELLPSH